MHAKLPSGSGGGGQFGFHLPMSNMLMGYSNNQKAAKEFLRWITSKEVYQPWFNSQQGFSVGATTIWENDPLWRIDPVMLPYRVAARGGRFPGYAGPADRRAAEVLSKYIVVDMYAKAVQGMPAEDSVRWAHEEVRKIHA
jgi:multiple sugar transport system substrate-binding protein